MRVRIIAPPCRLSTTGGVKQKSEQLKLALAQGTRKQTDYELVWKLPTNLVSQFELCAGQKSLSRAFRFRSTPLSVVMIVALRRSAPHAAAPGLARGRALPHSFRRRCAAGLSQRDNPYQLRHALRFFKPPMDAPKPPSVRAAPSRSSHTSS
jgi:hypothetical protein